MDEGKARALGPKPQWWSRPRRAQADRPDGAGEQPVPTGAEQCSADAPRTGPAGPEGTPAAEAWPVAPPPPQDAPREAQPTHPAQQAPADAVAPPVTAAPGHDGAPAPLHAPDPYGTPPYGGPGPWAPAPPVQRPVTPAHGTHLPPTGTTPAHGTHPGPTGVTPAHGTPFPAAATPQPGPWQYDPWAPRPHGAPGSPIAQAPAKRARRGKLVAGAALVALAAGGVGGAIGAHLERDGGIGGSVTLPQASAEQASRAPGSIAGIAARALPGVVTIHVRGGEDQGTGTGFVLDKRGHILTNNHVVEPAGTDGSISVTFNGGQTAKATVVGRDSGYDLAVIKVTGVSGLTPLPLGNSDSVQVGDSVVAIGAPFDLAGTVTTGIISAKERPITAGGGKRDGSDVSYVDALQTDAPINPGNSGGPLVDAQARVIGINSAIRSAGSEDGPGGGQGGSIGLGFAIPINQAKRVAEELINTGKATHPVIGVTLDMEYTGDGARVNTKGAKGPAVTPGGPGAKAGIEPRDVITKVDGVPVHSGQELIVKIRSHRPGDRLGLTVERGGRERTVQLTLGSADAG
ncbi:trypsin-like peptidase domain-containing protein [Streptomyces netropsis]|uniref:trypsin-like peptidase domain-containing protein n=1 Tax=Streptomyces netropsis TaxID=55404 RepID=UPI003790941E